MEKMLEEFLWLLFLGACTIEMVLKCLTLLNIAKYLKFDSNSYCFPPIFLSKIIFVTTNDFTGLMFNITFSAMNIRLFKCKPKMNEGLNKLTR